MSKVMETVIQIKGLVSDSVKKSISDVNKEFGILNKQSVATAAKFAAAGAAIAGTAFAMAGAFVKVGSDYTRAMNGISVQTGATGDELKELGNIAREVWAGGQGEDFQEVADALSNIKQASGLAGDELKAAAEAGLLLKDSFGMEVNETTRAASALMKNFGVSAEEAYGIIAAGAQNGANKNGDLLDTLNEYSVHYKALGLDADQFVTSLIKGAEAGAFSIDKVGDAVKEFTIRAKDGSKTSAEAFAKIGLDATTMTKAFAEGGEAAEAAFFQTVKALDAMEDPVAKNAAGVALFGTMFEDLEAGVLSTLGAMDQANVDAAAVLQKIEATKYNDLGYAIAQVGRSFQNELIPGAEMAGQAIYKEMPAIQAAIAKIAPVVGEMGVAFATALPVIIDNVGAGVAVAADFASFIVDNWSVIGPIIAGVAGAFVAFKVGTAIMTAHAAAVALAGGASTALTVGSYAFAAAATVASAATTAWGAAVAFLTSPVFLVAAAIGALIAVGVLLYKNWDTVKAKGAELWAYMGTVWQGIKDGAAAMGNGIVSFFTNAFNALPALIKTPVNAAISVINGAIAAINGAGFIVPDWVPIIGGKAFSVNIPPLPMLATGGFTNGPSIAGEAGTEAVISFDPAYRQENIGYLARAAAMLGVTDDTSLGYYSERIADLEGGSLTGGGTVVSYNLGGIVFSPTVTVQGGNAQKESIIEQLRNYQGELLELIEELLADKEAGDYGASGVF